MPLAVISFTNFLQISAADLLNLDPSRCHRESRHLGACSVLPALSGVTAPSLSDAPPAAAVAAAFITIGARLPPRGGHVWGWPALSPRHQSPLHQSPRFIQAGFNAADAALLLPALFLQVPGTCSMMHCMGTAGWLCQVGPAQCAGGEGETKGPARLGSPQPLHPDSEQGAPLVPVLPLSCYSVLIS